jgi:hypothetical protein
MPESARAGQGLPPFHDWQQAALAPADIDASLSIALDQVGYDGAYERVFVSPVVAHIAFVEVRLVSATDRPAHMAASEIAVIRFPDTRITLVTDASPPPVFGPDAATWGIIEEFRGAVSVRWAIAWRHGSWTVIVTAHVNAPVDDAQWLVFRLAERQRAKLTAVFGLPA